MRVQSQASIEKGRKSSTYEFRIGCLRFHFNPIVTICSIVLVWGFVIWAAVMKTAAKDTMLSAQSWITRSCTWLYIGTYNIVLVTIIAVYFSKYSDLRLGADDEKPEFGDMAYFTMLFAAGIGSELLYFSVAEPVYHYTDNDNRFASARSDNQRAQEALNITFFHWGVHGWAAYVLVSVLLSLVGYRWEMPMTMRFCMYPILGEKVFGRLGDFIDIISVVCTMFGVCTSLGVGVMQLNAGFSRMFPNLPQGQMVQLILLWTITGIATISVVSGVKVGIRRLSEICFFSGVLLMLVFFASEPTFLLNTFIQSVGHYLNFLISTGTTTEAFAQLNNSADSYGSPAWMNHWTIFYLGFWSGFCCFVGMFIAKISRGRTIKDLIFYTMTFPAGYIMAWFSVFGGKGISMERAARKLGLGDDCIRAVHNESTFELMSGKGVVRLSCRTVDDMLFDVTESYEIIGPFLSFVGIVAIALYFVTSADSGSLVIDCLASNGHPDPPVVQRIFWSVSEGACATALLVAGAGNDDSLKALQAGCICTGLFYVIMMNFMAISLWRALKLTALNRENKIIYFSTDLVDPFYIVPSKDNVTVYIKAVFAPWYHLSMVSKHLEQTRSKYVVIVLTAIPFYACVALLIASHWWSNLGYVAFACYVAFVAAGTGIRATFREMYGIIGTTAQDAISLFLAYPLAVVQLYNHLEHAETKGWVTTEDINHVGDGL